METLYDKGNSSVYAIGVGAGPDISFKLHSISKFQSLADSICTSENLDEKTEELKINLSKTNNEKKKIQIQAWIDELASIKQKMVDAHAEMETFNLKTLSSRQSFFENVLSRSLYSHTLVF